MTYKLLFFLPNTSPCLFGDDLYKPNMLTLLLVPFDVFWILTLFLTPLASTDLKLTFWNISFVSDLKLIHIHELVKMIFWPLWPLDDLWGQTVIIFVAITHGCLWPSSKSVAVCGRRSKLSEKERKEKKKRKERIRNWALFCKIV